LPVAPELVTAWSGGLSLVAPPFGPGAGARWNQSAVAA
jgi:hypothetical protein